MRTQVRNSLISLITILLNISSTMGQTKIDTIHLESGEVFDILLITLKPNKNEELKAYFSGPGIIAKEMSYQPLPGFKVKAHTQGNLQPDNLILAKWRSLSQREAFLREIESKVPDFHGRRRDIWSYFGMRYYEIDRDRSIYIDRSAYHVATALWQDNREDLAAYYEQWSEAVIEQGGEILISLRGGSSPFGYQYDPEIFVITAWESAAAFSSYQNMMKEQKMDNIEHINEYILE